LEGFGGILAVLTLNASIESDRKKIKYRMKTVVGVGWVATSLK